MQPGRRATFVTAVLLGLGLPHAVVADVETAELVAELDAKIPEVVARGRSPSLQVAVVHGDQPVWSKACGENTSVDRVYMNGSVQIRSCDTSWSGSRGRAFPTSCGRASSGRSR